MCEPAADNLRKRQCQHNDKVREAFSKKIKLDEIKPQNEENDIDRIFKIDLASLYKNINYICDTLKSGDSLYISRALKCTWLYDDEFKHVINPDNLHQNIFPFMSTKMKKKTLTTIAIHITDPERAHDFYKYCLNVQMDNVALDYLLKTSDVVKRDYIQKHCYVDQTFKFEHFFRDSINLIQFYLEKRRTLFKNVDTDLFNFRYLFSYSPEKYLDIFEEYSKPPPPHDYNTSHEGFGLRMSKEIMIRHKSRVLEKPLFYLWKINRKFVLKYTNTDDAKIYLVALLPEAENEFWNMDYYNRYKDYFNFIPDGEVYQFLRKIFNEKYPLKPFEMDITFYQLKYYKLLTAKEKNDWALRHLEEKKELLGPGQDFLWYRFVRFDKTFVEVKKFIYVTTCQKKRAQMIEVLVNSASTTEDCENLIRYYHDRHMNEISNHKENFVNRIIDRHNLFELSEKSWNYFYKLLHSLDIFDRHDSEKYKMLVLIYHIIQNDVYKVPLAYEDYCKFRRDSSFFSIYYKYKLTSEQKEQIYKCLVNYFLDKIKEIIKHSDSNNQHEIIDYAHSILSIMDGYEKAKEEIPEVILYCVNLQWSKFSDYRWFRSRISYTHEKIKQFDEALLIGFLKKDTNLFMQQFENIKSNKVKTRRLLSKIRIYFADEIARDILTFFEVWLAEALAQTRNGQFNQIVFGLFQLANDKYKVDFMAKHAPKEPKIQHDVIDKNLLKIQEAICRSAYYSRPPVPLESVLEYIKGDYVHFCLPMFNSYLVNLPIQQAMKFTEAVLNTPVSIQKHGLRLAFESYTAENLSLLLLEIWKKTKNISLRTVIFSSLYKKIQKSNEAGQIKLFEVLKKITCDLGEDDEEEVYNLLVSASLPASLNSEYLQTAWATVKKLSDENSIHINRKTRAVESMTSHMKQMDKIFCLTEVIDDHIRSQLLQKKILHFDSSYGINYLIDAKWNLVANYVTHFDNEEQLNDRIKLLQLILDNCYVMWNNVRDERYTVREFLFNFIDTVIDQTDATKDEECKSYIVPIFEKVSEFFVKHWPLDEIYCLVLNLNILILGRNAVGTGKFNSEKQAITYDLSISEIAYNFACGIIKVLEDLMLKQRLFGSMFYDMADIIIETIDKLTAGTDIESQHLRTATSYSLTKFNQKEAYLLAAHLLPEECTEEITSVLRQIHECEDAEVKTFVYQKFVRPNFIKRF